MTDYTLPGINGGGGGACWCLRVCVCGGIYMESVCVTIFPPPRGVPSLLTPICRHSVLPVNVWRYSENGMPGGVVNTSPLWK